MNALKKITDRARQLQKKHPNSKWISLVKKAGADYRAGRLGKIAGGSNNSPTRTSTKAHTSRNRTATSTKTITAHVKVGSKRTGYITRVTGSGAPRQQLINKMDAGLSTGAAKHFLKEDTKTKLSKALLNQVTATTKRDRRKHGKIASALKSTLRKIDNL
jgi:hypothetical protein